MTMNDMVSNMFTSPFKALAVSLSGASLVYLVVKAAYSVFTGRRIAHSYPPGPPRDPLIGAIRSFPKDHFYNRVVEWARLYGETTIYC
jgi:hypothetical protein